MLEPVIVLDSNDQKLIEEARCIIAKRFKEDYHHVGVALRTKSGKIFTAVHLEAYVVTATSQWQNQG
jgi:cytidine deaminase